MNNLIGQNVVAIIAPQDRHAFILHVINDANKLGEARFANDDGTPIEIEFSDVYIRLVQDTHITFGELEALNVIEGGYELVGDFGIFWVKCKHYSYETKDS